MATVAENQTKIDSLNVDISNLQAQISAIQTSSAYNDCVVNDNYRNCIPNMYTGKCSNEEEQKKSDCFNINVKLDGLNSQLSQKQSQLDALTTVKSTEATANAVKLQSDLVSKQTQSNIVLYVVIGFIVIIILLAIIRKRI